MTDYVVFDVETTGLNADTNEIIEIGAWKVQSGVVKEKFNQLIKPQGYLSAEIQKITGITPDMLKDAETIENVLPEFADFCGKLPLLGHNLPFDYGFMLADSYNLGIDFSLAGTRRGIDTLELSRKLVLGSHKLCDMADHFGIHIEQTEGSSFHRATYDAYVTKLLYDCFLRDFPALGIVTKPRTLGAYHSNTETGRIKNNATLSFE
jgi:DNA polymerase-3 subunit alpha (Gram-positive type)